MLNKITGTCRTFSFDQYCLIKVIYINKSLVMLQKTKGAEMEAEKRGGTGTWELRIGADEENKRLDTRY